MRHRSPRWWDLAIAAGAAAALIVDGIHHGEAAVGPADWVLAALTAAPLIWRTRAPLTVLLMVMAGVIACVAAFTPANVAVPVVMIPLYTVAVLGDRRRSLEVGAGTAVVLVLALVAFESDRAVGAEDWLRLVLAVGALVVGDTVRARRALAAATLERVEREAWEREQEGRRRVAGERLRIAQELHDTLAHALVAINVRAGVAVHLADPGADPGPLAEIKELSAEALGDLRATLSLLRDEQDVAPTRPALDLAAVSALVERAKVAGVDVCADVSLNGTPIPSPVGQAGFRIVQEAVTNILRHAHASSASVRVVSLGDTLEIDVTDDGRGRVGGSALPGAEGLGLRGMAERATALGGVVAAGPRSDGGWRVHARLPLGAGDRP
jgi:signal transduction histidine kinase